MFFYRGINQQYNLSDIKPSVDNIEMYKKYCDSLGISFLFLSMPNKESVYYKDVPFKEQPTYMYSLDSALKKRNIPTINALPILCEYKEKKRVMVYNLDDTHWNSNGVNAVTDEVLKVILTDPKFSPTKKYPNLTR